MSAECCHDVPWKRPCVACDDEVFCPDCFAGMESSEHFEKCERPAREREERLCLADERADILARFTAELAKVTGDGSKKRAAGSKPPWYQDDSHEGAVFSHITKWKRGELVDPDSGAHPLVHASWRLLAIALRETGNIPEEPDPLSCPPDGGCSGCGNWPAHCACPPSAELVEWLRERRNSD